MISDRALEHDARIEWEEPIEGVDYVRESVVTAGTRTRGVPYGGQGERVGYAVLKDDAPSRRPGWFDRRVFFLKEHDRGRGGDTYETTCPADGVDPRTVEPGKAGEQTDRALGHE